VDIGSPETHQKLASLPPGRKRRSPRFRRVRYEADGDGRLLALIRNATFISHGQLIKLAMHYKIKAHPDAVRKRIVRYFEDDLVRLVPGVAPYRGIYQITRAGLQALESFGLGLSSISSESEKLPSAVQATHFLDLNEVRVAFLADSILSSGAWLSDPEIKDRNTAPHVVPYAKDYDAVLRLKDTSGQEFLVGIEYERTQKTALRYEEIGQVIETEKQLCCVLYIAAWKGQVPHLTESIRCPTFPICVTAAGVLKQQTLDVPVGYMSGNNLRLCTLRQFLGALNHPL
jgi:hypothetical protein